MQIQVNTDNNIDGREAVIEDVQERAQAKLRPVASHLTRVEIHLADLNAPKGGPDDMRCMAEARPEGRNPIAVTHNDESLGKAVNGALDKLRAAVESDLGKRAARG